MTQNKRRILFAFLTFFSTFTTLMAHEPKIRSAPHEIKTISIQRLERVAIKEPAWVQARVIEKKEDDLYLIQDRSAQVLLFLSTDELMEYDLEIGQEFLIFGTIDLSPTGSYNELYAKKIYLATP